MEKLPMSDSFKSMEEIFKYDPGLENVRKKIKEEDVISEFAKIFPDLSKVAVPVRVDKKVLFLRVENSAWRTELKFNEKIIITKINTYFAEERVKYLKFSSK
jgi:hypothetical protein